MKFGPTGHRPDLFGILPGGWLVAEAKGRSNAMEKSLKLTLEKQKRAIKTINGAAPDIAVGCVASFHPKRNVMRVDAFDPEEDESDAVHMELDRDKFCLAYYAPFILAIDTMRSETHGESQQPPPRNLFALRIGLHNTIEVRVREAAGGRVTHLADDILELLLDTEISGTHLDGSVVETDWYEVLEASGGPD